MDALNQELFQLQMGEKKTVSDWGVHLSRHLQVLTTSFLEHFPPDHVAKLKHDHCYGGLPKRLKAMVAYLKASPQEKMYSDYLWAMRKAKKEDSMQPSQSHNLDNTAKPKLTRFFPLQKLKGPSLWLKCLLYTWHIWRRKVLRRMKWWIVRTQTVSKETQRSSWCAWQEPWKMPKRKRNVAITVAAWTTSSMTAHW